MSNINYLNKYAELTEAWSDKQAKLDRYVERWLKGEVQMSSDQIQQLMDSTNEQIEQLKAAADQAQSNYVRAINEEAMRRNAVSSVRNRFGVSPNEVIITGGVLSSNASESHLIGREKSEEELQQEREKLLNDIKLKVMQKEITLAEASKMSQDVNIAYGLSNETTLEIDKHEMTR